MALDRGLLKHFAVMARTSGHAFFKLPAAHPSLMFLQRPHYAACAKQLQYFPHSNGSPQGWCVLTFKTRSRGRGTYGVIGRIFVQGSHRYFRIDIAIFTMISPDAILKIDGHCWKFQLNKASHLPPGFSHIHKENSLFRL